MGSTFNSTSVADKTKDIKSKNVPLSLAVRRLTVNSEKGTSEFVDNRSQIIGHLEGHSSEEAQSVGGAHIFKKFGQERARDNSFGGNRSSLFKGICKRSYREEERLKMPRKSR